MKKRLTIRFLQRFAVLLVIALSAFSVEGHAQDARRVTVRNATTPERVDKPDRGQFQLPVFVAGRPDQRRLFPCGRHGRSDRGGIERCAADDGYRFFHPAVQCQSHQEGETERCTPPIKEKQTVTGYVKDAVTGEPMIGATVWLKDTSIGTSTDVNGFYSITFPSNYFVLSFSYLRYEA